MRFDNEDVKLSQEKGRARNFLWRVAVTVDSGYNASLLTAIYPFMFCRAIRIVKLSLITLLKEYGGTL